MPSSQEKCILIVEDNENVREVAVDFLANQGYAIIEAEDGAATLRHLVNCGEIDLLFTDVNLPGSMCGLKIANAAKRMQPGIKVLLTTGYAESVVDHCNCKNPSAEVILKPYRRAKLLGMIESLLDSNSYQSSLA
jgi:DNA-binding NtrC family response regulator